MNTKYSLYVARGEYRAYANETFYNANQNHTLLFTQDRPDGFMEVPECAMGALTEAEKRWLAERKTAINLEAMKRQATAITQLMEAFIAAFEAELEKGKENAENATKE